MPALGGELREIGPGHPEFGNAQTIRAAAGVLAKVPDTFPAIAQAIRTADRPAVSPRARAHFSAAAAWLSGNPVRAAESYAVILSRWPCDLLALRLAQSCYFFLGWHERLCALADAVTHAIAESGRHRDGAQWMREQRAHWAGKSRMRTHNAWHLAMFDAVEGNVASALGILDGWLLSASARSPLDACDAAALLWRLASEGVYDEGRWDRVSEAFERTMTPGFWPYVDLHAALAHLSAGKQARAQRLAQAIERCAQGGSYAALRARHITQPGLRALGAWGSGRYGEAARLLAGLQPSLGGAGGSRVQLEIFKSIEHAAIRRQRAWQCDQPQAPAQWSKPCRSSQQGDMKWKRPAAISDRAFAEQCSSP